MFENRITAIFPYVFLEILRWKLARGWQKMDLSCVRFVFDRCVSMTPEVWAGADSRTWHSQQYSNNGTSKKKTIRSK